MKNKTNAVQQMLLENQNLKRELEIEAALEKVRARTMTMLHSDELSEVSLLLDEQVRSLGIKTRGCAFNIYGENESTEWFSSEMGTLPVYKTPREDIFLRLYEAGQRGESIYIESFSGDACKKHYEYLCSLPGSGEDLLKFVENGGVFPESQIDHAVYFKYGYLLFITLAPAPAAHEIFKRFAKVFEQTYTRFLDLQKAEAQTREARIDLAVERVRAKALAMFKSEEIIEVMAILKDEVMALDIPDVIAASIFLNEGHDKVRMWDISSVEKVNNGFQLPFDITFKLKKNDPLLYVKRVWENPADYFLEKQEEKDFERYMEWLRENNKIEVAGKIEAYIKQTDLKLLNHVVKKLKNGKLAIDLLNLPSDEMEGILTKMGAAFDLAYRRFLDLQKVEAQAREAQIEAALERVRSRTLGMQRSEELQDAANLLFQQIEILGVNAFGTGFNIWDEDRKASTAWMAGKDRQQAPFKTSSLEDIYVRIHDGTQAGKSLFVEEQIGDELKAHYEYLLTIPVFKEVASKLSEQGIALPRYQIMHCAYFSKGYLMFITHEPVPEAHDIFKRFAKVFEQTYTRFLDLQKAEAQAREAGIELALERVRARTMAMQHSYELSESSFLLDAQVRALGIKTWGCAFNIYREKDSLEWFGNEAGILPTYTPPRVGIFKEYYDKGQKGESLFVKEIAGKECLEHYEFMSSLPIIGDVLKKLKDTNGSFPTYQIDHVVYFKYGYLLFITVDQVPEAYDIFKRFAKVFEQTYTRFLDLQKAEAQAREAQVEVAIERVRFTSMAMHKSEELIQVVQTLNKEIKGLGIEVNSSNIATDFAILENGTNFWSAEEGVDFLEKNHIPYIEHPIIERIVKSFHNDIAFYTEIISKKEKNEYFKLLFTYSDYKTLPQERKDLVFNAPGWVRALVLSKNSILMFSRFNLERFSKEEEGIFKRFGKVFEQAYARFLDLQKAERQAREAQIEASLERIRTQAMAMRHSDDLIKSTTILFEELEKLELPIERSGIGIFDLETKDCELWSMVVSKDGKKELATGITSMTVHPMLTETFEAWLAQVPVSYTLEGQDLVDYYQLISKGDFHLSEEAIGSSSALPKEYYEYMPFGGGGVYFFSERQPLDSDKQIIRRFAQVFHLTYTRYEDLQKAEARTLEAIKQASLDRVRGEIASMRSTADLDRITPLIWNELTTLGVPFIRCGVFIVNEEMEHVEVYLSSSEGQALGALDLAFDAHEMTERTVDSWRKKKVYHRHWNQEEFVNWTNLMIKAGQVKNQKTYQGMDEALQSLDLHFIPFTQGMLYVGSTDALKNDDVAVVQALADSFAIAYARYDDFVKLEKAKESIELTLSELKATQKQLIQSEKMASLGELTAGIAHEIQNPLNFVNNCSEVSKEMADELREEVNKPELDKELLSQIAEDLAQNQEKIYHHGQRASSIVKGMLEHSRTSSGKKELIDINALADEYLRLAYHGLIAKAKSFNADFKTDFDSTLPKVEVVNQEMGRVLLNLINNAFQAVSEEREQRKAIGDLDYKPLVSIKTQLITNNQLQATITDNGSGIPDAIKDKIFQPFFTTKDTGKGTGLGLSLAYNIVKAHGGEIQVESVEGEGSEFKIILPI